jgi:hypothetical protein
LPSARESIEVMVNVVEPLGSDMDVYMSTNLHDHVVGRVAARQGLELGKKTAVVVDVDRAHFFEPGATGMNLSLTASSANVGAGVKETTHAIA